LSLETPHRMSYLSFAVERQVFEIFILEAIVSRRHALSDGGLEESLNWL